jgi:uncharacterized SAM-binding protein YcdF (DUF218 family)
MTRRRRRWLLLVVAGGLLLALYVGRAKVLTAAANWLDVSEPPRKVEYLIVLNGRPETRAFAAAALIKGGWARSVILSTTVPMGGVKQGRVSWHELDLCILRHEGISEKDVIVVPGNAETTFDEAVAVARYLESVPECRCMVLTDGPHTRRTRWVLAEVLGSKMRQCTMVSAPMDEFQADNWWRSETGFLFIVSEYLKLGFYSVRYGGYGYGLAGCASLILVVWIILRRRGSRRKTAGDRPVPAVRPESL